MIKQQRATVHTIAKDCGVSASTVSLALRHSPLLKESTAKRIRAYADSINYLPNRAARNLKQQSTGMIGWIVPSMMSTANAELLDALYVRLFQEGYDLQVYLTQDSARQEARVIQRCLAARVEGLVITPSFIHPDHLPEDHPVHLLTQQKVPHLFLAFPMKGYPTISRSPRQATNAAYRHLREQGYSRIHLLAMETEQVPIQAQERFLGYRDAALAEGRDVAEGDVHALRSVMDAITGSTRSGQQEVQYRHDNRRTVSYGEELGRLVLDNRQGDEPIGLICNNDQVAAGVMRICRQRHLRIPDDVGLVGFDDSVGPELGLTSVRWDNAAMTTAIAENLLEQIKGNPPLESTSIGSELVIRDSSMLNRKTT